MKEIKQNGKTILYSADNSIPMIFRNLIGKNFDSKNEYKEYIKYVAIPQMGFTYGKIEYWKDNQLIDTGQIAKE